MSALRLYRRLLRTALPVLLMLGMVISPTLAAVGELHRMEHALTGHAAMEHATDGVADDAHGHSHPAGDAQHELRGGDADTDTDHVSGAHGLLHQANGVSVALPEVALYMVMPSVSVPLRPAFARSHLAADSPSNPFRPPIA